MKNTFKKVFIGFMAFAMATGSFAQQRAHKKDNESYPKEWKQIARMEQDSFFLTDEARRIAENVLAFQRCTGGWPKNIDMARRMNDKELAKAELLKATSAIDKAASKGVYHKNTASRKISRLNLAVNKMA